jgi:hypothetical protein
MMCKKVRVSGPVTFLHPGAHQFESKFGRSFYINLNFSLSVRIRLQTNSVPILSSIGSSQSVKNEKMMQITIRKTGRNIVSQSADPGTVGSRRTYYLVGSGHGTTFPDPTFSTQDFA